MTSAGARVAGDHRPSIFVQRRPWGKGPFIAHLRTPLSLSNSRLSNKNRLFDYQMSTLVDFDYQKSANSHLRYPYQTFDYQILKRF